MSFHWVYVMSYSGNFNIEFKNQLTPARIPEVNPLRNCRADSA